MGTVTVKMVSIALRCRPRVTVTVKMIYIALRCRLRGTVSYGTVNLIGRNHLQEPNKIFYLFSGELCHE